LPQPVWDEPTAAPHMTATESQGAAASVTCPDSSWPGWQGWVVPTSPLAMAIYGPPNAVYDVSVSDKDPFHPWHGSITHPHLERDRPRYFAAGNAAKTSTDAPVWLHTAQLASMETWMTLAEPRRCRLFDGVLERLSSRDTATRAWCQRNKEHANAWLAARSERPKEKKYRCVCSDDVNQAWEQCKARGCNERMFAASRARGSCQLQTIRSGDDPRDDENPICANLILDHKTRKKQQRKQPQFPRDCTVGFPRLMHVQTSNPYERSKLYRGYESGAKVSCFVWWDAIQYRNEFNCSYYEASPAVALLRRLWPGVAARKHRQTGADTRDII